MVSQYNLDKTVKFCNSGTFKTHEHNIEHNGLLLCTAQKHNKNIIGWGLADNYMDSTAHINLML